MITMPLGSTEYIAVPVRAVVGGQPVDPTVQMVVLPLGTDPTEDDWLPAEWVDGHIRMLYTPTARGRFRAWVRLLDLPEEMIRDGGPVIVI